MAKRDRNHQIGDIGESEVMRVFTKLGYACSRIEPDYGEDFFVFGAGNKFIEPFRLFVQVKASEQVDQNPSDWTSYEKSMTVRNWVLGNDLVIFVRWNIKSEEAKYCIPEDEVSYWDIDLDLDKDVPIHCSEKFCSNAAAELIWRARIRHYDRLVRITQPNSFEDLDWNGVPQCRMFVREFLNTLSFLDDSGTIADVFYNMQFPLTLALLKNADADEMLQLLEHEKDASPAALLFRLMEDIDPSNFEVSEDMSSFEKARYEACCLLVLVRLKEISGHKIGLAPFFLDQCAHLLVNLIHARTKQLAQCE